MTQAENRGSVVRNRLKTWASQPANIILLLFGILLTLSTVVPIIAIVRDTFMIHPGTIDQHLTGRSQGYTVVNYIDLFTSRLARANLWRPLFNTLVLAALTCVISIFFGGLFAFLVTRTNMKLKKYLSAIFIFPYIMPQWTLAVVWQHMFYSNRITGTSDGLIVDAKAIPGITNSARISILYNFFIIFFTLLEKCYSICPHTIL